MTITDQRIADSFLEELINKNMQNPKCNHSRKEANSIERENIGYFAGYYDVETRERMEKFFGAIHPVFGPVSKGIPTATQAFELGLEMGRKARTDADRAR